MNGDVVERARAAQDGPLLLVSRGKVTAAQAAGGYARVRVAVDGDARLPLPGQYMMVRFPWGPALPRALSALGVGEGWIEFFVKTSGTLREAMAAAPRGAALELRGPYGVPYHERIDGDRRYVLVGGGSGVAPLLAFADTHPAMVASLALGVRSAAVRALLPGVDLAVEEGGGETATDRLAKAHREGLGVIACGPEPMLAAVARRHRANPAAYVSLETRLGCGFGACLGCTIPTPAGLRRVCTDGPLFACSEVPWLG